MAKAESSKSKKLKALEHMQQINEALQSSTIESEALLSSGESRPTLESHVLDLLDQKFNNVQRPESSGKAGKSAQKRKHGAKKGR